MTTQPTRLEVRANMQLTNLQIDTIWDQTLARLDGHISHRAFARALLAAAPAQSAEPVTHEIGGRAVCRVEAPAGFSVECVNEGLGITKVVVKAAPQPAQTAQSSEPLAAQDVERQYRDGIHIGSGLPRATCPCGFCMKHRFGFNRGDDAPQPSPTAVVLDERAANNAVEIDRRDLFDFVRGGIKSALEAGNAGEGMVPSWYWQEATERTERVLGNLGVFGAVAQPVEQTRALTEEEIENGWHKTFSTNNPYCPCNLKSFTKAVRWAEWALTAARPASGGV